MMSEPLDQLAQAIAAVAPHADAATWVTALTAPMRAAGLTTPRRIAMFLGQCAEETGGFEVFVEDLYYTSAAHIREVWPGRFPTLADAAPFVGEPEWLADCVYAGRMGNGDGHSGDGWRFRGRGLIQLSGRTLYTDFAETQDRPVDDIADWLATPEGAAASACWYWSWAYHGALNALADDWNVPGATKLINGGFNGLATRIILCANALAAFGPAAPEAEEESEADKLNDAQLAKIKENRLG